MSFYSALDSRSLNLEVPTVFEIISANELAKLLTPSLKYVLVHYTHKYPKQLLKVYSYFDELNLAARAVLEYNFLKRWNTTFTEKFYGIKRASNIGLEFKRRDRTYQSLNQTIQRKTRLSNKQIIQSLFLLVGVPYLKEKLDVIYAKISSDYLINKDSYSLANKNRLKLVFIKVYPYINSAVTLLQILLQILYISGRTVSPSISSYLLGVRYLRLSDADYQNDRLEAVEKTAPIRPPTLGESINESVFKRLIFPLGTHVFNFFDTVFPVMMFSLKFLEWWQQSDLIKNIFDGTKKNFLKEALETASSVPLPRQNRSLPASAFANNEYGTCALCGDNIHNPAMIETGYVFCYPCITKHITESHDQNTGGRCPITGKRLLACSFEDNTWKIHSLTRLIV